MEIRKTDDGSQTLFSEKFGETYHSSFGAVTESEHVFIEAGLKQVKADKVTVFELGFGTGLNTLLTLKFAALKDLQVVYHTIELYPVPFEVYSNIQVEAGFAGAFSELHQAEWDRQVSVRPWFELLKIKQSFFNWQPKLNYNLIYFDAFSPESQPEFWTGEIFQKLFNMLSPGGILTTYCAKGYVRRNMIMAGFKVERLLGPPGKREMLRARK